MTFELARAMSVALCVALVPGALAAVVLGFRRFTILEVAAPLSLAGIAAMRGARQYSDDSA